MFYLLILILSIFVLLFFNKKNDIRSKIKNKFLLILSYLIIMLPHGLRYGIGTDYFYTYVPGFFRIGLGQDFYTEIGFSYLNKIIYNLTGDYRVMFFVTSAILFYFLYKSIVENSNNLIISVILIFISQFYFSSMNLLRQAIAMSIIFYGFKYLKNDLKIKFVIICLFASLFHNSSFFMIPLIFLYNKNFSRKNQIITCLVLLCLTPFLKILIEYVIVNYTKYGWYYQTGYAGASVSFILVITNLILFIIGLLYFPRDDKEDYSYKILNNINFLCMCITVVSPVIPLIFRVIKYFTTFHILFVPAVLAREVNLKNKLLLYVFTLGILAFGTVYQIFVLGGEEVYPYVSIFS